MNNPLKPRVLLPYVPGTYYGSTSIVGELKLKDKLYIGDFNRVEEMYVEEVRFDENLNSYEIETDKAILLATPMTRVARCSR